jgi:subtilase family serine protease
LRRAPEEEQALDKYMDELEDPNSPNYHHWLTAPEIGQRYGLAPQDLATITDWLKSHDFTINQVFPNGIVIDFSGNASQVNEAFHTEIHRLEVSGKMHVANFNDPQIPSALAPAVVGVVSLNDFRPQPQGRTQPNFRSKCSRSQLTSTCNAVAPADLATIYNLKPLFSRRISGQGETIAVVEDSDVYTLRDWRNFRSMYRLSKYSDGSVTQVNPGRCDAVINDDESEAIADAEWSSAAAPSAAIEIAACKATSATPGQFLALEYMLNSNSEPPAIVSISYGQPEAGLGMTENVAINEFLRRRATRVQPTQT